VPSALPAPGCRCRALPLLPLPGASGRRSPEPGQTWELVLLEPGLAGQLHSSRLSRSDGLQRGGSAQPCAEQGGGERGDHGEASERICLNRIKRNVGSAKVASARAAWSIAAAPGSAGKASAALPAGSCRALSALPPGKWLIKLEKMRWMWGWRGGRDLVKWLLRASGLGNRVLSWRSLLVELLTIALI